MAMPTLLQLTFLVIISFLGKFPQTNLTSIFAVDTNLIQLDTDDLATNTNTYADNDDDLIFEVTFYFTSNMITEFLFPSTKKL